MAHEMTSTDNVVLHREKAWHGLGVVVENAPTPAEAIRIGNLDWEVAQWPIQAMGPDGQLVRAPGVANIRLDTQEVLGLVSGGYEVVQQVELAEFCESLNMDGVIKCESVGSIRGGRKVWFLLKGLPFDVRAGDEVVPYLCVSNGHDGRTGIRCTPTSVRVVCSNTLHMVIPRTGENEQNLMRADDGAVAITHFSDVRRRLIEAKAALEQYAYHRDEFANGCRWLSSRDVSPEALREFFLQAYTRGYGPVPVAPQNEKEQKVRERATVHIGNCLRRFEAAEHHDWWNAVNSYTETVQHDGRNRNHVNRAHHNLLGINADRSTQAFVLAYGMAS